MRDVLWIKVWTSRFSIARGDVSKLVDMKSVITTGDVVEGAAESHALVADGDVLLVAPVPEALEDDGSRDVDGGVGVVAEGAGGVVGVASDGLRREEVEECDGQEREGEQEERRRGEGEHLFLATPFGFLGSTRGHGRLSYPTDR